MTITKKKKDTNLNKVCSYCESVEDSEHKLQTCSRCLLVAYCSKECQRAHWKNGHKQTCIPVHDRKPQPNVDEAIQETKKSVDVACVICLEPLRPSSSCTLPCSHSFHSQCVYRTFVHNLPHKFVPYAELTYLLDLSMHILNA
jgi:hypothetical protein